MSPSAHPTRKRVGAALCWCSTQIQAGVKNHKPWYRRLDSSHTRSVQLRAGVVGRAQVVVIPAADPVRLAQIRAVSYGAVPKSKLG